MRYSRYHHATGRTGRIMAHWASRATDATRLALVLAMVLGTPAFLIYQSTQGSHDVKR